MPSSAPALGGGSAVTLDADVFEQPFNGPLVHEGVIAELAARRQGTHATKTRGMGSGGGASGGGGGGGRTAGGRRGGGPARAPARAAPRCGPAAAPSSVPARAPT